MYYIVDEITNKPLDSEGEFCEKTKQQPIVFETKLQANIYCRDKWIEYYLLKETKQKGKKS